MPHLLLSSLPQITYPFTQNGYTFIACFANVRDSSCLLWVQYGASSFFLIAYPKDSKIVLKAFKQTAPTPSSIVQGALLVCKHFFANAILSDNLATRAPLEMRDSFLLQPHALCALVAQNRSKPIMLEIGFGSGRRILQLAASNPHALCVGIEIHSPSIEQVLRQIALQNLQNLVIVKADARLLFECLPSNCLSEIALHFPIPWPKRHRRVFTQQFCKEAQRVLAKGGKLHLRTDDEGYFRESFELLLQLPSVHCEVGKNRPLFVTSKYESRWILQKKQIWDLLFECEQENEQNDEVVFGFSTDDIKQLVEFFAVDFVPSKKCQNGILLSITSLYRAQSQFVVGLCLGSVAYPQTTFLVVSQNQAFYCPALLPLAANKQAHQWLKESRRER